MSINSTTGLSFSASVLIFIIHYIIAKHTYGKLWCRYFEWQENGAIGIFEEAYTDI